MTQENVVDDAMTKVFNKLGITGLAAAILTIIFGLIVLTEWVPIHLILGLYLIILGVMNLTGYVITIMSKKKDNVYIETETLKTK